MAVTAEELIVKIVSDTSSAEAGLKNVGNLLASLLTTATGAGGGVADMGAKVEAAAAQAAMLDTKATAAAMAAQNLGTRAEQAAAQAEAFASKAALGGANAEAMGLKAQAAADRAQDLGVRAYAAGGQAEYLGAKAAAAGAQADAMAASAEQGGGKLAALAGSIDLGTVAAAGLTAGVVALVAGLADATVKAAEFQTQLSQAQANTTMTTQQTQAMGQAILDMSAKSGAGLADLGAGYVHIVNLLGDTADATKVLDVAQQSAVATGGKVNDTAQALARVMKEFGLGTDDAATAMDTLHTAAAAGDLTLEQFTENSGNALAQAALMHVPLDQAAASYVTLTKHGMDAADANTQLADQFLRLTTVTPKVADELARVSALTGVDLVGDFSAAGLASKGLTGIYADLSDAEHKMGLSAEQANAENMLLGDSLRGGRGLMIDVAYQTNDYLPILGKLDDATASATKRQDDFNRSINTTAGQWNILKAEAGATAVVLGGPLNDALGGVLAVLGQTAREAGTWNDLAGTLANAWVTDADVGKALGAEVDRIRGSMDGASASITTQTADLYDWGQTAEAAGTKVAAALAGGSPSDAAAFADTLTNAGMRVDHATGLGGADPSLTASLVADQKAAHAQALADAKTYYADQATTAKDAATATKTAADAANQAALDSTKAEIASEKQQYDDRAQADIKSRQDQTQAALASLQAQETAQGVSAAAANALAGQQAQAANAAAGVAASAANTLAGVQGQAAQRAADESDTAWKAQVTAIKDAATAGENAIHTANDANLKSAIDTANDGYNAQVAAIDGAVKAREEGDARDIHSHELATAANIANIDREKSAALAAIDQETAAYAAQETARVKLIDSTLAANVKALNDQLAAEKRANTERLAIDAMNKASGGAAGTELGQYFTASDAAVADTEAALAAKQAGNQALADQDTAAAQQQTAAAQALSDQLSQINQATADQMVTYRLQTDTTITADQVAALTQQATDQKQALTDQLATEKQAQADKKAAATSFYDGEKAQATQALADYKWTMAQDLQAFKDAEDQKKAADKAALDLTLTNIAIEQTAENARHADAIAKIAARAKTDTDAIDALATKRKDEYAAETARRAADFAKANADRAADYTAATNQRTADYAAQTAARAAQAKSDQAAITATGTADVTAMQNSQKEADRNFTLRTTAADAHFKDVQTQITNTYNADAKAITDAQAANALALTQMGKDTKAYADQATSDLQGVIDRVSALTGAMGGAAAGGFHAPGKGPLDGAGKVTAADFADQPESVRSIFTGTYNQPGQDPAAIWAQQANKAGSGGGAGAIAAMASSEDVVVKSGAFLGSYAFGSGANTMCEAFVEQMEGRTDRQGTAYDAATSRQAEGAMRFDMPPPAGAEVYFAPAARNDFDGHVGISLGNGMFRSVTETGVQDYDIATWPTYNPGASFLGWVPAHTPMYDQGGVVPGAYGQPSLAIVHGGEEYLGLAGQRGTLAGRAGDGIDYDRMAAAFLRAVERLPAPVVAMDGTLLAQATRQNLLAYKRRNGGQPLGLS